MPGAYDKSYSWAYNTGCAWYPHCKPCEGGGDCQMCSDFAPAGCDWVLDSGDWITNDGGLTIEATEADSWITLPLIHPQGKTNYRIAATVTHSDSSARITIGFAGAGTYLELKRGEYAKIYIDGSLRDTGSITIGSTPIRVTLCVDDTRISSSIDGREVIGGVNPGITATDCRISHTSEVSAPTIIGAFSIDYTKDDTNVDCVACLQPTPGTDCAGCDVGTATRNVLVDGSQILTEWIPGQTQCSYKLDIVGDMQVIAEINDMVSQRRIITVRQVDWDGIEPDDIWSGQTSILPDNDCRNIPVTTIPHVAGNSTQPTKTVQVL